MWMASLSTLMAKVSAALKGGTKLHMVRGDYLIWPTQAIIFVICYFCDFILVCHPSPLMDVFPFPTFIQHTSCGTVGTVGCN